MPADEEDDEDAEQGAGGRAYQSTLITAEDFLDGDGDGMLTYPPPSSFVGSARPPVYGYDFSFPDDDDDDDDGGGYHVKKGEQHEEDNIDDEQEEEYTHAGQVSKATVSGQKNFEVSKTRRKS